MPHIYSEFLKNNALKQIHSIQSYELNGQKVWLKKAAKRHSTWIYIPLQWFSKWLGLSMLAPVANHGGNTAICCELQRIQVLKKQRIHVPDILASQPDAILLKDASANGDPVIQLDHALAIQSSSEKRLQLFHEAIDAVEHIHLKKSYLSEAFARNILVDRQHIFAFIDFETDPAQYLSLADCQTRDWLCFIFSTSHHFKADELTQVADALAHTLRLHPATWQDVCRVGQKISWLLALTPEKLGRDAHRLKQCICVLKILNEIDT